MPRIIEDESSENPAATIHGPASQFRPAATVNRSDSETSSGPAIAPIVPENTISPIIRARRRSG